jgi:serine/threonine-protein kinase
VWTSDGKRIIFASSRESGVFNLWWQAADGTGDAERLTDSPVPQFVTSVTPDGRHAIFWVSTDGGKGRDVAMVALDGSRRVTPLLQTPDDELFAAVSPNGRWLAYESSSSGRRNVYVRPFPRVEGGQWQITTDEGRQPTWSRDGKELFFLDSTGSFMRVRVIEESNAFRAGPFETVLGGTRYYGSQVAALVARTYDVSPDGVLFVLKSTRSATSATSTDLMIVQHWSDSLHRRDNVR